MEIIKDYTDIGFPYFITIVLFILIRQFAGGFFPWFKDDFWAGIQRRWEAGFHANIEREAALREQSRAFLDALDRMQNGFAATNSQEHEAIIGELIEVRKELQEYKAANISLTQHLIDRLEAAHDH